MKTTVVLTTGFLAAVLAVLIPIGGECRVDLFNNGDGTFQPAVNIPTAVGTNSIVAAKFTPWSSADLAVTNGAANSISILYGLGDGTFEPVQTITTLDNPRSIAAGDFYEDGCTDLACIAGNVATSSLCFFFNDNM